jgi:hypothetical protein
VAATEVVIREQPRVTKTSRFFLFHCYAAKATSSRSSTCICDWESRSLEPSSLVILYRERVNKIFGSDLRGYSLASSSSSPQLIYLFVRHAPRVVAFNVNSVRPIIVLNEP